MSPRVKTVTTLLPHTGSPIWLLIPLLVGIALRHHRIGANSLWFDESFSWLVARQPAWDILTQQLAPIMPPLYHFIHHFWLRLFGEGETALRSLSLASSVASIPMIYLVGRVTFAPAVGLAAAVLMASLPFHIYFAQDAYIYSMVVLLATCLLLAFVWAWRSADLRRWVGFGLLAAVNLYTHYFVVFVLLVLHIFVLLTSGRDRTRWRGLLVADSVALVLVAPQLPSAWAQLRQVSSHFWLAVPSPLEPVRTLDYLLFGHTTPSWLVPAALFVTLALFVLVAWTGLRVPTPARRWLALLLALVLAPMVLALALSWLVTPLYLDRSFSLVTPAYVVLLAWGMVNVSWRSPVRWLFIGLAIVGVVSLDNHYTRPDPAKPPFREVGATIRENWRVQDVLLNLHDSSYLPLRYYTPHVESYLLNNDPDTWLPGRTWEWAGQRVTSVDEVTAGKSRLWLVVMPGRLTDRQRSVLADIEARYAPVRSWRWPTFDAVEICLYELKLAASQRAGHAKSVTHEL